MEVCMYCDNCGEGVAKPNVTICVVQCPRGKAWADISTATDTAHAEGTECSNRGICDRSTGKCTCQVGFEGLACERMKCPTGCSGHGRCISMNEYALTQKDSNNPPDALHVSFLENETCLLQEAHGLLLLVSCSFIFSTERASSYPFRPMPDILTSSTAPPGTRT